MAHPKLATVVGRSFLTATAAVLVAGPLAAAGAAQTLDDITDTLKLTCEEAVETEDEKLIDEFCTQAELDALATPLQKSVDEVTDTTDKVVEDTTKAAPVPTVETPGEEDPGTAEPGPSLPGDGDGASDPDGQPTGGTDVGSTGGEDGYTPVDGSGSGSGAGDNTTRDRQARTRTTTGAGSAREVEAQSYGFNADGPFRPGMRSNSSLTLQPFAAPLVSVPPVYELPQIASQLFGGDAAATAEDPMVAGASATQASPYSAAGYTATDPTGWLAATATGLIMLVGAGHAINGGRTPKEHRA